jgi:IclR family pca regulon transcriptional regulator
MKPRSPSNRNASLEKAHRLLLAFNDDAPELGVMDLARRVGLNKSTVSRFVATLTEVGLLERVEGTKKIRLGLRVFELGTLAVEQHPLARRGAPILERLAVQVRETVTLLAPMEDSLLVLQRHEAGRPVPSMRLGRRYPLLPGAAGLAFLSGAEEGDPRARLAGLENRPGLRSELARARAHGFASVEGDPEAGLQTLASPVHDRSGAVVAAICVTAPQGPVAAGSVALTAALRRAAADFSRRLGFHRGEPTRSLEASAGRSARSA